MSDITITLPNEVFADAPEAQSPDQWVLELTLCQLYREGRISTGRAARLLGVSRMDFMAIPDRHKVPYFDISPAELAADLDNARQALHDRRQ